MTRGRPFGWVDVSELGKACPGRSVTLLGLWSVGKWRNRRRSRFGQIRPVLDIGKSIQLVQKAPRNSLSMDLSRANRLRFYALLNAQFSGQKSLRS